MEPTLIAATDQHDNKVVFSFAHVAYLVRREMAVVGAGTRSGTAIRFVGGGPEIWVQESIAELLEAARPPADDPPELHPSRVRTAWPWSAEK